MRGLRFGAYDGVPVAAASNAEMQLYDQLGPLARAAIGKSPRIINIANVLREVKTKRPMTDMDSEGMMRPLERDELDRRIAAFITRLIEGSTGKKFEEFVIEPKRRRRVG